LKQVAYRIGQYFRALWDKPEEEGLIRAREILSPPLFDLFMLLLPFEQAHAIRTMSGVVARGYDDLILLQAALLHDVGKARHPLRPWERVAAVILKKAAPSIALKLERREPKGLQAGLVVAAQHAEWGAQMAAEAGADEQVVWLIRHHQCEDVSRLAEERRVMLEILREVDARS
jgi:putative nucleotidyltransferase with HDIG domain